MRHLLVGAVAASLLAGCAVGDGVGSAEGSLYVRGCKQYADYGKPDAPAPYNLNPTFFAGEPIEDIRMNGTLNRIVLRLQDSGKSNELDDMLQFDVVNSYLVGACLAGVGLTDEVSRAFCQTPPGQTRPRMRIGPSMPIRVSLALRSTCPFAYRVGSGRDADASRIDRIDQIPIDQWRSWIDFTEFGSATSSKPAPTFKVEFGERISAARYHVDLIDDRVTEAARLILPPPAPEFIGVMDGNFAFKLERGQGAQTFP